MAGIGIIGVLFLLIALGLFVLHIALCVWAYRDARDRGYSSEFALLVLLALLFFPVVGLIVYLIIREDRRGNRLR
ncbi:PLDc N-terminal domain-containing protein [Paenibacillus pasadenensis]|uniref:Cardiolipin synthase N-terminal domain-containing protein n=1 Tax=Paenibacillus pasadenensis TaxID=217090 RepID=A0A2N5N4F5_9BACL|nr:MULTISPECIES: PLDc N-terminal domain-containing protein [Paenibacillus]PLT45237.1 hypothetical protein B8V81_3668 [Paenibacillus pasadenensis]QGG58673.1 hypothetical protein GE073_08620 [Paenibacillus sp. B01]